MGAPCPEFYTRFVCGEEPLRAFAYATAWGVYVLYVNGVRVGEDMLSPGCTEYDKRLQVEKYDITALLRKGENEISAVVSTGWHAVGHPAAEEPKYYKDRAFILEADVIMNSGDLKVATGESWLARESKYRSAGIYGGVYYDSTFEPYESVPVAVCGEPGANLIPREGVPIRCTERVSPVEIKTTPKGETVLDFGRNVVGTIEFRIDGPRGAVCGISCAEILKDGNFYNDNYRAAKSRIDYVCDGRRAVFRAEHTFFGFRYLRLENWPRKARLSDFTACKIMSDMTRTGYFECSDERVNKLFGNIVRGQEGNFLDIPTDCPQRDERLGWTGDAQVFVRCASLNYDIESFYRKWLRDLAACQKEDGSLVYIAPRCGWASSASAGWSDAAVICPWQIYLTYGNDDVLRENYPMMARWIGYMYEKGDGYLNGKHFGDWLCTDGGTDNAYIALCYRIYSTDIMAKTCRVIGLPDKAEEYEKLASESRALFKERYIKDGLPTVVTQTACVLMICFKAAPECDKGALDLLCKLIKDNGDRLSTGFLGTPYLLHVLSDNGRADVAYTLLLQTECPSWLYQVERGATTMWERWDGILPSGEPHPHSMNSFNHYAYGAVGDWLYGAMAGINVDEAAPGFKNVIFRPVTDPRIDYASASVGTKRGVIKSEWRRQDGRIDYTFVVPRGATATAYVEGRVMKLVAGKTRVTV
ncbi:MAG: family 78 glycoside hydrolase catalytic domain [Clostridia bacterium]|nr:family 78 glycoside hydrolase catalytic domain [Clostridia bacterium]